MVSGCQCHGAEVGVRIPDGMHAYGRSKADYEGSVYDAAFRDADAKGYGSGPGKGVDRAD